MCLKDDTERPSERNSYRDRDQRTWIFRLPGQLSVWVTLLRPFGRRTRRWRYRWKRFRLAIRPGPVYVEFSGFCCDTGSHSWAHRFENGFQAWRATSYEALEGVSDGPTGYQILTHPEDIEYYFPAPCDHEYERDFHRTCGARICMHCGHHEGLARCFCGWTSRPGENVAGHFRAMGEVI
jgi:hypothetical protein